MSKSVVLVLEPNHESEYGEYANTPAFNAHGDIIGWTGGEVPESGHSCEFNVLNDEGFTTCASSTTVNTLQAENAKLRGLASLMWRELHAEQGSAQRRMEISDRMRELGVEVDDGCDLV